MYHQRPTLPRIQPVPSNPPFPGGLSSDSPLRHSSASPIVHSRCYSHPRTVHNFPENSQSSYEPTGKPTLPSFRETFPEHVDPHLHFQPSVWEGQNFQLRRGSPCPSSVHDGESHGSQHSSPYAPSRSITPDTLYVYPPQPRPRSPLPPVLQPMASLRLSANSRASPMSTFESSPFTAPSEPSHFSTTQRGLKLSIPSPFAPHPHPVPILNEHSIGSPGMIDDVQMLPEEHQENRRPVLRPVQQRLPAGLHSDWEQFVREIRDENGDYYLQCIWDIDTGHACLYQAEKQAMKRHVEVTHMRIKPHKCPYCDKRFGQKTAMKVHRATHTGETPLECGFKCGRYFSDPARRHRHYTHDHNYTPRKRHNTNRNRTRQAKEARAAAAVRAARSPSYSD